MDSARAIRDVVFCGEQGVPPELEWDGEDKHCEHFLAEADGKATATARVRPYGPSIYKIERVAVLKDHRGTGAGKAIMKVILSRLRGKGTVVLNAQAQVEKFYLDMKFVTEGEPFEEAGISHVHMVWRP